MVGVQEVSIAVASASVVAGIVYYSFHVGHQTRIRKTDLMMRLFSTATPNREYRSAREREQKLQQSKV